MKYYKLTIFFLIVSCCICLVYLNKKHDLDMKQKKREIDSLKQEILVNGLIINRYEMTLEILKEKDPDVSEKFEETMSTETE